MRYVIIGILVSAYLLLGCPDYLSCPSSSWFNAVTYHLFHANIFHLAANCLSIWYVFKKTPWHTNGKMLRQLSLAFVIATLSYFVATRPVVGISNILFAILGLRTPAFNHPWWKQTSTLVFFAITLLMLFIPQFSAVTHIVSFLIGVLVAMAGRTINSLAYDYRQAAGK